MSRDAKSIKLLDRSLSCAFVSPFVPFVVLPRFRLGKAAGAVYETFYDRPATRIRRRTGLNFL